MEQEYDILKKYADGKLIWIGVIRGLDKASAAASLIITGCIARVRSCRGGVLPRFLVGVECLVGAFE
jgi:hypothetical protein